MADFPTYAALAKDAIARGVEFKEQLRAKAESVIATDAEKQDFANAKPEKSLVEVNVGEWKEFLLQVKNPTCKRTYADLIKGLRGKHDHEQVYVQACCILNVKEAATSKGEPTKA